jgi:DtxR family transcriptional regulator, manganese transport regulator
LLLLLLELARVCQCRIFLSDTSMATKRENSPGSREMPRGPASGVSDKDTAAYQRRTRRQHAQERAQDYVEAIAELISSTGEARATDLARSLGVTHVTVIRTVQRLQRDGLVTSLPYRSIFLTEAGRKLASRARSRHRTVVAFLEALGISSSAARADAEGIEHHVSAETLAAFERFLEQSKIDPNRPDAES